MVTEAKPESRRHPSLTDGAEMLRNTFRTLRLVARVLGLRLAGYALASAAMALCDVATAWVGKRIIDAVVASAQSPYDPTLQRGVVTWVLVEFGVVALGRLIRNFSQHTDSVLRSELGLYVNGAILEKSINVSYRHFEDPEFMNLMTQARREASFRPYAMVSGAIALGRDVITLTGYLALLASLGPWAAVALVLSSVPAFMGEAYFGRAAFERQSARTMRNRQLFYLEAVLTTEATAKEVKLFSLGRWITEKYREIHRGFHAEEVDLSRRRNTLGFLLWSLSAGALYGAYLTIARRAALGAITLGAMTLYLTVFTRGQGLLQSALGAVAKLYEHNLYMSNLFEFLEIEDDEPDRDLGEATEKDKSPPELRFEKVTWRYPGAGRDALSEVSLTLSPGETVALVGRNGAGKTSLIKLLVGLYRPTSGRILLNGEDTALMHPSELRRRVGVIFQDFARFQLSAADNIGVGWLPLREDRKTIERAVRDAGAEDVIARLPQGLDTPLGRAFGGDDLSVGQWQRIALARAFMRSSGLLVLDEPTASLDAESEHEVFLRFRDLKAGRTALLITHRFASVRMADRVVVLEDGRVTESGTHEELMARKGSYERMFSLQAQGYAKDKSAEVALRVSGSEASG